MSYEHSKKIIDFTAAALALFLLSPILITAALFVFLSIGRPILYRTKRAGKDGKPFILLKLRSMTNDVDVHGTLLSDEQRITAIGRLIRRTSIDELPQLINVLRGDMSLVGPRPLPLSYTAVYDDRQAMRLNVKPGLTGWCQVNYRGDGKLWQEKLEQDAYYVEHQGMLFDIYIIFLTFGALFRRFFLNRHGLSTSSSALSDNKETHKNTINV